MGGVTIVGCPIAPVAPVYRLGLFAKAAAQEVQQRFCQRQTAKYGSVACSLAACSICSVLCANFAVRNLLPATLQCTTCCLQPCSLQLGLQPCSLTACCLQPGSLQSSSVALAEGPLNTRCRTNLALSALSNGIQNMGRCKYQDTSEQEQQTSQRISRSAQNQNRPPSTKLSPQT